MSDAWRWMISDASLPYRVAVGVSIFAWMAIVDYRAHRQRATRWREYAFLFLCVGFAMAYGILNDLITSRISVEYFLYGKGVAERVSAEVAGDPDRFRGTLDVQAMRIGALATWSAGLIAGAAILITNSVGRRPRLRMRSMLGLLPLIGVSAVAFAIVGGLLGYAGAFTRFSADFAEMVAKDEMRPARFMAVFGIHLGGYVGALVGLIAACVAVVMKRRIEQEKRPDRPGAFPVIVRQNESASERAISSNGVDV